MGKQELSRLAVTLEPRDLMLQIQSACCSVARKKSRCLVYTVHFVFRFFIEFFFSNMYDAHYFNMRYGTRGNKHEN